MALLVTLLLGFIVCSAAPSVRIVGDHDRLVEQALTDPLTGAFNRRHLEFCLDQVVARRTRLGEPASLLLIDIDHFKRVNDTWGHTHGDIVLRRLVALMTTRGRRIDLLFRLGGEEFVVLLANTPYEGARIVAESLREAVSTTLVLPDGERMSISIGVSELEPGQTAPAWIDDADAALYRAKQSGRNRVSASGAFALKPVRVM